MTSPHWRVQCGGTVESQEVSGLGSGLSQLGGRVRILGEFRAESVTVSGWAVGRVEACKDRSSMAQFGHLAKSANDPWGEREKQRPD